MIKTDRTINRNENVDLIFYFDGDVSAETIYLTAKKSYNDSERIIDHECDNLSYNSETELTELTFSLLPSETQSINYNVLVYDIRIENSSTDREVLATGNLKINLTPRQDSDVAPASSVDVLVINPSEATDQSFPFIDSGALAYKTKTTAKTFLDIDDLETKTAQIAEDGQSLEMTRDVIGINVKNDNETRLASAESNIVNLDSRISQNESNLVGLVTVETIGKNLIDTNYYIKDYYVRNTQHDLYAITHWSCIWMLPVNGSTTYKISGDFTYTAGWKQFYDKDGVFISADSSRITASFTTPSNCRYVSFNVSTDYTVEPNIQNTLQLEEGSVSTAYEKHYYVKINDTRNNVIFFKNSNDIYIRSSFNDKQDVVIKTSLDTTRNLVTEFSNVVLIDKFRKNNTTVYSEGVLFHSPNDDITPVNTGNCGYITANHGYNCASLTVASHDKTSADVGSIWSDGTNQWYLAEIISATNLIFARKTSEVEGTWVSSYTLASLNLTHVSGATHTTGITGSSQALEQMYHVSKNVNIKYLVDGKYELVEGINKGEFLDIIEDVSWVDPSTLIFTSPMDWSNGNEWFQTKITYRFQNYGNCLINYELLPTRDLTVGYIGVTQMSKLTKGNYSKLYAFMNRVMPLSGYDFAQKIEMTTNPTSSLLFTSSYLQDTDNPPDKFIEYLGDSDGTLRIGFAHGFINKYAYGKDVNRVANNTNYWNIHTSGKSYPRLVDNLGVIDDTDIINVLAYRQYFDPNINPTTLGAYCFPVGNKDFVYIQTINNLTNYNFKLPEIYKGKEITTIYNDRLTIHDEIVTSKGIRVSTDETPVSDLMSGWNFTSGWSVIGTINDSNTFTTTSSGGVYKAGVLTTGKIYKIIINGSTTALSAEVRWGGSYTGTPLSFGTHYYKASGTSTNGLGLYIRNNGAGVTDITELKLYELVDGVWADKSALLELK